MFWFLCFDQGVFGAKLAPVLNAKWPDMEGKEILEKVAAFLTFSFIPWEIRFERRTMVSPTATIS